MQGETWQLGQTLDGFNDLLYGGFGLIQSNEEVSLIWNEFASSRAALGYMATRNYYLAKLTPGSPFNQSWFQGQLTALEAGHGKTYFEILLEIIGEHPNIHLIER